MKMGKFGDFSFLKGKRNPDGTYKINILKKKSWQLETKWTYEENINNIFYSLFSILSS